MADYLDLTNGFNSYRYWVLENWWYSWAIKSEPGNYVFVKLINYGWVPVYIGIADDLSTRLPGHERWAEASRLGATRVFAHVQADKVAREAQERALIAYYNPPLNFQHRTKRATLLGG